MKIQQWLFKLLKKKTLRTDGHTDARTDNVKTVYPTTNKVCGYPPHSKIQWKTLHSKIQKAPSMHIQKPY